MTAKWRDNTESGKTEALVRPFRRLPSGYHTGFFRASKGIKNACVPERFRLGRHSQAAVPIEGVVVLRVDIERNRRPRPPSQEIRSRLPQQPAAKPLAPPPGRNTDVIQKSGPAERPELRDSRRLGSIDKEIEHGRRGIAGTLNTMLRIATGPPRGPDRKLPQGHGH